MKVSKDRTLSLETNIPVLVQVIWLDAMTSDADPYVPVKNHGGCLLSSMGHLVEEDEQFVFLSCDLGELGDGRHGYEIPKVNIVQINVLTVSHRRKVYKK